MKWECFEPSHNTRWEQRWWDAGRAQLLCGAHPTPATLCVVSQWRRRIRRALMLAPLASSLSATVPRAASYLCPRCRDTPPVKMTHVFTRAPWTWTTSPLHQPLGSLSEITCHFFKFFFYITMWQTAKNRTSRHHLHTVIASGTKGKQHLKEDSLCVEHKRVGA